MDCPETSTRNYRFMLRNIPEDRIYIAAKALNDAQNKVRTGMLISP